MDDLRDRLKQLRKEAGLSAAALGRKMDSTRQAVWNVENTPDGVRVGISLEQLERWVEACGRTLRVEFALVGGADAELVSLVRRLDPSGIEALSRWARLWPHLPGPAKRAMATEALEWEHEPTVAKQLRTGA